MMIHRNIKTKLFAIAAMTVVLLGSGIGISLAKTTMELSNQFPASHYISKGMVVFAEKVREHSKGAVDVKIFNAAQLYKDTEIVEAIQDGLLPAGLIPVNKWAGMIAAADVFEVPFIFNDLSSIKKFLDAGAAELFDNEFQQRGVKTVMWVDLGYVQFWNSKRPLTKPEDFKGLKMRSFSNSDADTLQALGASPVVMSSSEVYMAMQRGTVDGGTTGWPAAVSRKLTEVQKFATEANYATPQFAVQASLKWWKKLSKNEQDAILKAGKDAEEWIRQTIVQSEADAEKVVVKAGVQVYRLDSASRDAFIKATESVQKRFLAKSGSLGKKLLDIAAGIRQK